MRAWIEKAIDAVPHIVWVALATFGGAFATYLTHYLQTTTPTTILTDLQTKAGIVSLLVGAIGAGLTAGASVLKMPSNATTRLAAKAAVGNNTGGGPRPSALPPLGVGLLTVLMPMAMLLAGCISAIPTAPVNAGNADKISTCQATATEHNAFVLSGIATGASATGLGSASALVKDNAPLQTGLAIGGVIAAGLTTIAAGGAGLSAGTFAAGDCSSVVGALPMKAQSPAPQAILPRFSEMEPR